MCSLTLTASRPKEDATVTRVHVGGLRRIAVLALPSLIVLAATGVTTGVAAAVQERSIRTSVVEQVSGVASSLAELPEVRDAVVAVVDAGAPGSLADADALAPATAALQPIASLVEGASGVSYVVVTDDDGVRITHPDPAERGEVVETTIAPVLAGERFVGTETGPSGATLRAKVPIVDAEGRVVGVVAVGVLESTIAADRARALGDPARVQCPGSRVVVDHEHAKWPGRTRRHGATAISTSSRAPPSVAERPTRTDPPRSVAVRRTTARPMPRPSPVSSGLDDHPRVSTRCASAGSIPGPSSSTVTVTVPSRVTMVQRTVVAPASAAFRQRLATTSSTSSSSTTSSATRRSSVVPDTANSERTAAMVAVATAPRRGDPAPPPLVSPGATASM